MKLTAPIVFKDLEKRIVYGPVLIPDERDTDDDVISKEKIEELAHAFLKDYGNVDVSHSLNNVGKPVENYLTPVDLKYELGDEEVEIPQGSWMLGVYVEDDDTWAKVKNEELNGFSIMAVKKPVIKALEEQGLDIKSALKSNSVSRKNFKEVSLADLGEDFIVNAVSLVDEPAVPKAKWVAIKSKKGTAQKELKGTLDEKLWKRKIAIEDYMKQWFREDSDEYCECWFHPGGVFEDYAVVEMERYDGESQEREEKFFRVNYFYSDEAEELTIIGEPKEVRVEEVVIPVENEQWLQMVGKMEEKCPDCAQKMKAMSKDEQVRFASKLSKAIRKNTGVKIKQGNIQHLIDTWDEWAGDFSGCADALEGQEDIDNPEAVCAWLHYQAEGKWPAEEGGTSQSLVQRITSAVTEALGFGKDKTTKAGRVISDTNKSKIENAKDALNSALEAIEGLISVAENERSSKSKNKEEDEIDMDRNELKEVIESVLDERGLTVKEEDKEKDKEKGQKEKSKEEEVQKKVEKSAVEELLEKLIDKMESVEKSLTEDNEAPEEEEPSAKDKDKDEDKDKEEEVSVKDKDKEDDDEEDDPVLSEIMQRVEMIEKAVKPKSKSVVGQDGDGDKETSTKQEKPHRDAYGRKIKKEDE